MTIIEPRSRWLRVDWPEIWRYRELLGFLAWRDIKVRYKQTVLGALWAVLQPVLSMVTFSLMLGRLAKMPSDGIPYPLFVLAGLLPWTFFGNALNTLTMSMISNSQLITKIYFPRLIIPLSSVGAGLMDLIIGFCSMGFMMAYYGVRPGFAILALPILLIHTVFAVLGVGSALSALTVAYRDFRHVVPFTIQTWMFLSPVVYPVSLVPSRWRPLYYVNPMVGIIDGYRSALLSVPFNNESIVFSLLVSSLLFVMGSAYFRQVERRFADII